jgi:hypothetical protein
MQCSCCKKEMISPKITNAAGSFCEACYNDWVAKGRQTRERNKAMYGGYCIWCGDRITPDIMQKHFPDANVCQPCCNRRDWLLAAIRLSDHPAKYVARIEEKEKEGREQREKIIMSAEKPANAPSDDEARLRRIELMLNKFSKALGVE